MYKDRHIKVERNCEQCGNSFMAQQSRIKIGQGRFCSLECANLWQKENSHQPRGFENGVKYFSPSDGRWIVRWYDEDGNPHTTSYAKWWWIMNMREIPEGYVITYKDENPENIDPSNFDLVSRSQVSYKAGKKGLGVPKPSIAGENSRWWRGGVSRNGGYAFEFSKSLKKRIKIRDGYVCQCCYFEFESRGLDVHHIDKDKHNNSDDNLVTVCKSCHRAIHGTERKSSDRIRYFQSRIPY